MRLEAMTSDSQSIAHQPNAALASDAPVRWQEIRFTQFGFVNNTVLGLATAALGFALTLARSGEAVLREAMFLAVVMLLVSHAFAISCALNRLWDFRETFHRARGTPSVSRAKNRRSGQRSCCLLYLQLGTFGVGVLALTIAAWPNLMASR